VIHRIARRATDLPACVEPRPLGGSGDLGGSSTCDLSGGAGGIIGYASGSVGGSSSGSVSGGIDSDVSGGSRKKANIANTPGENAPDHRSRSDCCHLSEGGSPSVLLFDACDVTELMLRHLHW
jgi:hypothetical protein